MSIQPVFAMKRLAALLLAMSFAVATNQLTAQQTPAPPQLPPPGQALTPDQLNDLVAPIALYPDELVSQIMVAATYPLEVVEAAQFVQQNQNLKGPALTQAAQQQDWDPSVQALVLFPDVLKQLNSDVTWTTNLGNAFLAQQQDVMGAVQTMRQRAQQNGKLQTSQQETVTNDGGYVDIEPADPDVIYVPVYNPEWIWGPSLWYPYPSWGWPAYGFYGPGVYFGWGLGINMGFYFGSGWHGWHGWGWHPGWGAHSVIVNNGFIHSHGFNARGLGEAHGTSTWAHDPGHRGGVPYANPRLNQQFRGNVRQAVSPRAMPEGARTPAGAANERFGNRDMPANRPAQQQNRSAFGGQENGAAANTHSEHGFSSMGPSRSAPASAPRMSAPAPRMSAPAPRSAPSAPRGGGGRR
jgi:Protein of unknown function (DUF3300)